MLDISVYSDIKRLSKNFDSLTRKQLPFATALALTNVARAVQTAEVMALPTALKKKPTPFTKNAFGVIAARKTNQTAIVFAKDKQAAYLAPSEFRGAQLLGDKRAILNPKDIQLNQYHNIARGKIAQLKGRQDIFFGAVNGSSGAVSGVWQRLPISASGKHGALHLLIRWGDGVQITQHLGYHDRAALVVKRNIDAEFSKAIDRALATAK